MSGHLEEMKAQLARAHGMLDMYRAARDNAQRVVNLQLEHIFNLKREILEEERRNG